VVNEILSFENKRAVAIARQKMDDASKPVLLSGDGKTKTLYARESLVGSKGDLENNVLLNVLSVKSIIQFISSEPL